VQKSVTRVLFTLLVIAACHSASGSNPSIESVRPPIAQRGSIVELQLEGSGFSTHSEFLFYRSGVTCQSIRVDSETALTAQIACDKGCPLGAHPFRLRTSQGISELRVLHVTPLPVANEKEPNNDAAGAQKIESDSAILGALPGADVDFYRVSRKKGQRISAEVQGIRLGIGLLDTKLRLLGPESGVLIAVDDTPLFAQDPYFTFLAPVDGDYLIEITNSAGEGDDSSIYALHIGDFPRPSRVFPSGGRAGQSAKIQFFGDATGASTQEVPLPAVAAKFGGLFAEQDGKISPTANPFRVTEIENVLESEPNQKLEDLTASASSLPIAFNGILSQSGDEDLYRFTAKEGQLISFEAYAAQIGSLADTVLSVCATNGRELARNDDSVGLDSKLLWKCLQDGEYLLKVQDKRGAGGEGNVYRVEATLPSPSITSFLARRDRLSQSGQMVRVPRGNRVLALVGVRRDGWSGEAEVGFPQLPPGVAATSAKTPKDQYLTPVVLETPADAPLVGQLVTMAARATAPDAKIEGAFEQVVDLVASSADRAFQTISVDRLAVVVTEPAPFRIRLEPPATSLPQDGSLDVIIHVERDANFQGAIEITFPFLPSWVDGPEKITIAPEANSGAFRLRTHPEVASQNWPLVAEGKLGLAVVRDTETNAAPGVPSFRRRGGGGRRGAKSDQVVATQLVTLEIAASPISGAIGQQTAEPGNEFTLTIPLERTGTTPNALTASLVGLPNRVTSEEANVAVTDKAVTFKVRLASDAPLGEFANLFCELTGQLNGQTVVYRVGRGGSLKIVRPGEFVTDASGRALSRLEILRKAENRPDPSSSDASLLIETKRP
jgi:hypothetical protein